MSLEQKLRLMSWFMGLAGGFLLGRQMIRGGDFVDFLPAIMLLASGLILAFKGFQTEK